MAELLPCPFCGGEGGDVYPIPAESTHSDPPVHYRQIYCFQCDSRGPETLNDEKAALAWNTRTAPSTRMADVRLWTWTDESNRNPNVYAVRYCGTEMFTTNSANAAKSRCDELNLAATVTLPDAKKCEADRGIDWYAAYERMAHNRNELWAKLKAVEAALAHKEGR